jgi:hypothetical protein
VQCLSEALYVGMRGGMHWFGLLGGQSIFSEVLRDMAWRAKNGFRFHLRKGGKVNRFHFLRRRIHEKTIYAHLFLAIRSSVPPYPVPTIQYARVYILPS